MNKLEFQHVLLVCRILDVGKEKKLVEKVFVSANKQRNNNPASDARSLTRFEFFEALLNLACHRFGIGAWKACVPGQSARLLSSPAVPRLPCAPQTGPLESGCHRPRRSSGCWTNTFFRASHRWPLAPCVQRCRQRYVA